MAPDRERRGPWLPQKVEPGLSVLRDSRIPRGVFVEITRGRERARHSACCAPVRPGRQLGSSLAAQGDLDGERSMSGNAAGRDRHRGEPGTVEDYAGDLVEETRRGGRLEDKPSLRDRR